MTNGNKIYEKLIRELEDQRDRINYLLDIIRRKELVDITFHEQLHFLQELIDSIPVPIFYKDMNRIYRGCNISFQKFLGLTKDQIVGKTVYDVAPKELADIYYKADKELFEAGGIQRYESSVRDAEDELHDVIFHKAVFHDTKGEPAGIVGVILDITDLKRTENELKMARDTLESRVEERTADLKKANIALGEEILERKRIEEQLQESKAEVELYIDLMGHDINNMNQIAMGYLELALGSLKSTAKITDDELNYVEKSHEMMVNSSKLISNVRKLQSLKSKEISFESVDIGKMIEEVRDEYQNNPWKKVIINLNFAPKTGYFVCANYLLKDAISNIVGNAVKHSIGDVCIDIYLNKTYEDSDQYYKLTIDDNGPGIPDELKEKVFRRLERGMSKVKGTGLGLYLVRMLVEYFNGKIWVEDRIPGNYGMGSRFVLMLPAKNRV
ncbi:hypothetical protein CUJ83_07060 [Methanocella sp. CWC-04]|uniref:PAS domain S-box-containing protein n=1 Tax=Methanooceanicella nereidis TaxID=2052831 RepID=A0AAP2RCT9_9EURY|nr:HAMP domain-containing sensor histidine kinase [Methanocella sp. CWC-04]MCD1294757.1 hypothetical protein [Methanocella sp. CWC-04]